MANNDKIKKIVIGYSLSTSVYFRSLNSLNAAFRRDHSLAIHDDQAPADEVTQAWENYIQDPLDMELEKSISLRNVKGKHMSQLSIAGRGLNESTFETALVIRCTTKGVLELVRDYCKDNTWLDNELQTAGIALLIVARGKFGGAVGGPLNDERPPVYHTSDAHLQILTSAETLCGHPVIIGNGEDAPKRAFCTFGGTVLVGGHAYGLLARHPFEDFETSSRTSGSEMARPQTSDDEDVDDMPLVRRYAPKPSAPGGVASEDTQRNRYTSPAITILGEGSDLKHEDVTDHLRDGQYWSIPLRSLIRPAMSTTKVSTPGTSDWILANLSGLPEQIKLLADVNIVGGTQVRQFWGEDARASGAVQLALAGRPFTSGVLRRGLVSFPLLGKRIKVQEIVLEYSLPRGSSGAWVTQNDRLCGIVVGVLNDTRRCYMLPIGTVVSELQEAFPDHSVRLPSVSNPQYGTTDQNVSGDGRFRQGDVYGVIHTPGNLDSLPFVGVDYGPDSGFERSVNSESHFGTPKHHSSRMAQESTCATQPSLAENESSQTAVSFQTSLRCMVHATIGESELTEFVEDNIYWTDPKSVGLISASINKHLQDLKQRRPHFNETTLVRNSGTLQVHGKQQTGPVTAFLNDDHLFQKLVSQVGKFLPAEIAHIDFELSYIELPLPPAPSGCVVDAIQEEILRRRARNFQLQPFLGLRAINDLTEPAIIEWAIREEASANHLTQDQTLALLQDVQRRAPRLFLTCIDGNLPVSYLQHILSEHGMEDDEVFHFHGFRRLEECRERQCLRYQPGLETYTGRFFAASVDDNSSKVKRILPRHVTLPIMHSGEESLLGEGAFARVYRVTIEESYFCVRHYDPRYLAIKHFKRSFSDHTAFEREVEILHALSLAPHPHIAPHLASWTCDQGDYILYPLADCNLRTFFTTKEPPSLTKDDVLWLLEQLKGLAQAIEHVHSLVMPDSTVRTAFHHDLKPENVLLFKDSRTHDHQNGRATFKIADFGAGGIFKMETAESGRLSPKERKLTGSLVYAAPDFTLYERTSRPSDMWALGCIFLEILIWLFIPGITTKSKDEFATQLFLESEEDTGLSFERFWIQRKDGTVRLNSPVTLVMDKLEHYCRGMPAFIETLHLVQKLLEIDPRKRMRAAELSSRLNAVWLLAYEQFRKDPQMYLEQARQNSSAEEDKIPSEPDKLVRGAEPLPESMELQHLPGPLRRVDWPEKGVFSTFRTGYTRPEKVRLWGDSAFGPGYWKCLILYDRAFLKSPRKPTVEEKMWMEDSDPESKIYVPECGKHLSIG